MTDDDLFQFRRLWQSVILRAIADAVNPSPATSSDLVEKHRARNWLTIETGVTHQDFLTVCEWAGVDPHTIRAWYRAYERSPNKENFVSIYRMVTKGNNINESD